MMQAVRNLLDAEEGFLTGTHSNRERPHQGLEGRLIIPPANENMTASIQCRERLGGLLRFYHRSAA